MIADAGTPWRREMVSMVSPCATMMAVPPSQLQAGAGCFWCVETEPVTYWRAGVPMPAEPPYVGGASAEVSTLCVGAGAGCTEPVTSGDACGREANGVSIKRSLLQPANPAAKAANRARRDTARERAGSTKEDMDHSLVRNNGRAS